MEYRRYKPIRNRLRRYADGYGRRQCHCWCNMSVYPHPLFTQPVADTPVETGPPVAGQALWLDALRANALWQDTGRTIPAGEYAPVASWYDATANIAATQSGATSQPLVVDSGLEFDGANDHLVVPGLPIHTWPGMTVITAFVTASVQPAYAMLTGYYQAGLVRWALGPGNNPQVHGWAGNGANINLSSPSGAYAASTRYLTTWRKGASSGWEVRRNTTDGSVVADSTYPNAQPTVWIGAEPIAAYWYSGQIRMVLVYPRLLSNSELTTVLSWAGTRHGVTL